MAESERYTAQVFGEGFTRCFKTGRPFEVGSGCLSEENQSEMFLRDAALEAAIKVAQTQALVDHDPNAVDERTADRVRMYAAHSAAGRR